MTAYLSLAPRSLAIIPGAHLFDSCHMCTLIGSQCMAAHRSCVCPVGSGENVLPFFLLTWEGSYWSVTRILLWNLVSVSTCQWWRMHFLTEFNFEKALFFSSSSRWLFHQKTCIVYAFCGVLFGLCSLSNLTALSCVCWLKVCCPNYGKSTKTNSLSGSFNLCSFSLTVEK